MTTLKYAIVDLKPLGLSKYLCLHARNRGLYVKRKENVGKKEIKTLSLPDCRLDYGKAKGRPFCAGHRSLPENRCIGDFARCEPNKKGRKQRLFRSKIAKIFQNGSLPEYRCIVDSARCEPNKKKEGKQI